jgi:hypothetical protein
MLAERLNSLLPPRDECDALEVVRIHLRTAASIPTFCSASFRFARRTTPRPPRRWSAPAGAYLGPEKFRSRTKACCFSTSRRSSTAVCWNRCANRWNRE